MGSSFLWIAIAIDHVEVGVVPLGRCLFGAAVLALFPECPPSHRSTRLAAVRRAGGTVDGDVLFLLYPIAERTVSSSITGMINGGLPVVSCRCHRAVGAHALRRCSGSLLC